MTKFAIVIGVNEYKRQGDLLYAEGDASEFADSLVRFCGFSYDEVALLTAGVNEGKRVELSDVQAQLARAKNGGELESFVFFFCGRGRLDEDKSTRRFCLSGAEEGENSESFFTLKDLLEQAREIRAANGLFFFDARSSSEDDYVTKRELNAFDEFAEEVAGLWKSSTVESPNVLAVDACSNGQTSYDDSEYERGLASSHLTWTLKGYFTPRAPTFAQLAERLPEIVAARAVELQVGARQGYQNSEYAAQRPCCSLFGDGAFALSTHTISKVERAAAVVEVVQRGEQLLAAEDYQRARLAAERALELDSNNKEAQELRNRAYRAEVSLIGGGNIFGSVDANGGSKANRPVTWYSVDFSHTRRICAQTWNACRWIVNFRDKGYRFWKLCFWLFCVYVLCNASLGLISSLFITHAAPSVLPQGIWAGTVGGDSQFLTVGDVIFPFRYCPPGKFTMGSPWYEKGRALDERRHKVTLTEGFWLLETETTQLMWRTVCGTSISYFKGDGLPVDQPTWYDCQDFIEKLNELGVAPDGWKFTLPTEAQWEYACRAGENESQVMKRLDDYAWYWGNATETRPVGIKKANAWGLHDMRGNLWEWVADVYAPFLGKSVVDPKGPRAREGAMHVLRGGCWGGEEFGCRAASRYAYFSGDEDSYCGFRIALVRLEAGDLEKDESVGDESIEGKSVEDESIEPKEQVDE